MHHTVTLDEINAWLATEVWHMAASSSGGGSRKRLEVSHNDQWRVTDREKVTNFGTDRAAAVAAYNEAP